MNSKLTKDMTVGSIVAEDFNRAQTLEQMGIDYCCHGSDTLQTACEKRGLNADDVLAKLATSTSTTKSSCNSSVR